MKNDDDFSRKKIQKELRSFLWEREERKGETILNLKKKNPGKFLIFFWLTIHFNKICCCFRILCQSSSSSGSSSCHFNVAGVDYYYYYTEKQQKNIIFIRLSFVVQSFIFIQNLSNLTNLYMAFVCLSLGGGKQKERWFSLCVISFFIFFPN